MQIKLENICYRYKKNMPWILKNLNFKIDSNERVALVGSSGSGKSTLSKIISGYIKPSKGKILLGNSELDSKGYCPIQMIYQHPEYAVNPRWKMKKILNECWTPGEEVLARMGIEKDWLNRWPSELSGGELQRFCIARVLSPDVKFLLCDEITTMLDVITQAQIWQVLLDIAKKNGYGMLIITHNMALAEKVCTRIVDLRDINHIKQIDV